MSEVVACLQVDSDSEGTTAKLSSVHDFLKIRLNTLSPLLQQHDSGGGGTQK